MGRLAITDRGLAVGLLQAGVSKQEVGLRCSYFLANGLPELIDFLHIICINDCFIMKNSGNIILVKSFFRHILIYPSFFQ